MEIKMYFVYPVSATAQTQNATNRQASGRNCRRCLRIASCCTL